MLPVQVVPAGMVIAIGYKNVSDPLIFGSCNWIAIGDEGKLT